MAEKCAQKTQKNCPYGSEFISKFRKVIGEKLKTQDVVMCGGTCLSHSTLEAKMFPSSRLHTNPHHNT